VKGTHRGGLRKHGPRKERKGKKGEGAISSWPDMTDGKSTTGFHRSRPVPDMPAIEKKKRGKKRTAAPFVFKRKQEKGGDAGKASPRIAHQPSGLARDQKWGEKGKSWWCSKNYLGEKGRGRGPVSPENNFPVGGAQLMPRASRRGGERKKKRLRLRHQAKRVRIAARKEKKKDKRRKEKRERWLRLLKGERKGEKDHPADRSRKAHRE